MCARVHIPPQVKGADAEVVRQQQADSRAIDTEAEEGDEEEEGFLVGLITRVIDTFETASDQGEEEDEDPFIVDGSSHANTGDANGFIGVKGGDDVEGGGGDGDDPRLKRVSETLSEFGSALSSSISKLF